MSAPTCPVCLRPEAGSFLEAGCLRQFTAGSGYDGLVMGRDCYQAAHAAEKERADRLEAALRELLGVVGEEASRLRFFGEHRQADSLSCAAENAGRALYPEETT